MQKCERCNNKFGYKKIFRSLLFFDSPIVCEGCGSEYYIRFSTKIIYGCFYGVPLILIYHFSSALGITNKVDVLGCFLIWIPLVILGMPLWARYYLKE